MPSIHNPAVNININKKIARLCFDIDATIILPITAPIPSILANNPNSAEVLPYTSIISTGKRLCIGKASKVNIAPIKKSTLILLFLNIYE